MRTTRPRRRKMRRPGMRTPIPRSVPTPATADSLALLDDVVDGARSRPEVSTVLTGGDVDADWRRAESTGEEAVGGSVATPDQDIVDEIGRALGVEQDSDAELRTSGEILANRDRHYWHLERRARETDEG